MKKRIVYDCTLKRPGCPIIQNALGGTPGIANEPAFPGESWLVHRTPNMQVYEVTDRQLELLTAMAHRQFGRKEGR